ncbi:MAG: hypothetical protein Q8O14_14625 [bacterium]|nr:hypothetical protein [bacterium]
MLNHDSKEQAACWMFYNYRSCALGVVYRYENGRWGFATWGSPIEQQIRAQLAPGKIGSATINADSPSAFLITECTYYNSTLIEACNYATAPTTHARQPRRARTA